MGLTTFPEQPHPVIPGPGDTAVGPRAWPGDEVSNAALCLVWSVPSSRDSAHGPERGNWAPGLSAGRVQQGRGDATPFPPLLLSQSKEGTPPTPLLGHPPTDPGLESVGRALNLACLRLHRPDLDSWVPLTSSGPKASAAHPNPSPEGSEGSAPLHCSFPAYLPRPSPLRLILAKAAVQPGVGGAGAGSQLRPRPRPLALQSPRSSSPTGAEPCPSGRPSPAWRGWGVHPSTTRTECGAGGGTPDSGPGFHCLDKCPRGCPTFGCEPRRSRRAATRAPTARGRLRGGAVQTPRA